MNLVAENKSDLDLFNFNTMLMGVTMSFVQRYYDLAGAKK